jgi:outer membrane usher protein
LGAPGCDCSDDRCSAIQPGPHTLRRAIAIAFAHVIASGTCSALAASDVAFEVSASGDPQAVRAQPTSGAAGQWSQSPYRIVEGRELVLPVSGAERADAPLAAEILPYRYIDGRDLQLPRVLLTASTRGSEEARIATQSTTRPVSDESTSPEFSTNEVAPRVARDDPEVAPGQPGSAPADWPNAASASLDDASRQVEARVPTGGPVEPPPSRHKPAIAEAPLYLRQATTTRDETAPDAAASGDTSESAPQASRAVTDDVARLPSRPPTPAEVQSAESTIAAAVESAPASAPATGPKPPDAAGVGEVWLTVTINGQERPETALVLRDKSGRLLVREEDLRNWRLRVPSTSALTHDGASFYRLEDLRGLSYRVNEAQQALALDGPPSLFEGTQLRRSTSLTVPSLPPLGGFLNYDLFATHVDGLTRGNGLLELGGFGKFGAAISSFLARDVGGSSARYIRLETTLTQDHPADLSSFRFGDAISRAGTWGRPVRFGGAQWSTNFATQPGFVTFPLPSLAGEAVLPSTVDLYVNDALRLRREIPSGPFTIPDLPIVTGQGEARLIVRDLLGRERVIVQPYYATPRLLQPGLHDFSYELGVARRNYGFASDDYGRALAVGTHRFGFSDRFTGEAHGEVLADQRTLGLGGAYLWNGIGVMSGSVAGSHGDRGTGGLLSAAFERNTRQFSVGANTQVATHDFVQLGLQPNELAPNQISQVFASTSAGRYGSFGVNYVQQSYRDRDDVKLVSGTYNVNFGKLNVGFSVIRFLNGDERTIAGLTLTLPLDSRTTASATATAQHKDREALFQVQRNLPAGTGVGYRLAAGVGDSDRREAAISAQNDVGTYTFEASHSAGDTAVRASASGGVATIGGKAFMSRRISDSFAVVELPEYPNVRVYADNQLVARTGNDGAALLPRLRAYETNAISIEQADLPLDAQVKGVQVYAVPYYRSGMLVKFPVTRSRGALLKVVLADSQPLPSGAVVQLVGADEEFPVGLNGEIYVTGLQAKNQLRIIWRSQSCDLDVAFAESSDPIPDLGTYTCGGVVR